jgi:uncharacterized SAM-binding protein YcdF (DUF218 family)
VRPLARGLRRALRTALFLALLWLGGLVWFVADLGAVRGPSDEAADAVVVLTGGSRRLEVGLELLEAGKGRKLFLSGVPQGVGLESVLRQNAAAERLGACCIVLGHEAGDTIGNAEETARWLDREGFRSLHLVTADYHMRRALLEFGRVLPRDDRVIPEPVEPEGARPGIWRAASRVVVIEYTKYLGALARTALILGRGTPA